MPQSQLHELLKELHTKLSEREPGPIEDRQLVGEVMSDLNQLLRDDSVPPSPSHAPVLAAQAVRLESSHPDLVPIIRQIVDILGQAGV